MNEESGFDSSDPGFQGTIISYRLRSIFGVQSHTKRERDEQVRIKNYHEEPGKIIIVVEHLLSPNDFAQWGFRFRRILRKNHNWTMLNKVERNGNRYTLTLVPMEK